MSLRIVLVCAESNMVPAARQAARQAEVILDAYLAHDVHEREHEIGAALDKADVLIMSMINVDAACQSLTNLLRRRQPRFVLPIHCQPELLAFFRLDDFSGDMLHESGFLARAGAALAEAGIRVPPVAAALLATLPRALEHFPAVEPLVRLRPYAVAASLWQQATPDHLERLFVYLNELASNDKEPPVPVIDVQPRTALWHPAADQLFTSADAYMRWYETFLGDRPVALADRPRVGVILFRQLVLSGDTAHYRACIEALERAGLAVIAGFSGLDNTPLVENLFRPFGIELLLNLTGFNLVGSMGSPNPEAAVQLLDKLNVPYIVAGPLLFQSLQEWLDDPIGLAPTQTALQVVLPEIEGGIEPRVIGARHSGEHFEPIVDHVERLARRVARWIQLRRKPVAERRLAISIFSFPPDKGAVGTAAYLDVFASLHAFLHALAAEGYDVGELPASPEDVLARVLGGPAATRAGAVPAYDKVSTADYKRMVPYYQHIESVFGPAPGQLDSDGRSLAIRGAAFGNVFVGIQPSFGYEGDPMRLLFEKNATPSHSFAAYYAWLEKRWQADAIIHFGTHGSLEFMPGKQVGLSTSCYPELLIGDAPHLYFYSINNPSEATIAKRRSGAVTISYLSPPLAAAGLYRELRQLQDDVERWYRAATPAERDARWRDIVSAVRAARFENDLIAHGFDADIVHATPPPALPLAEQGKMVDALRSALREIEQRLIPIGLHVAGRPLDPEARAAFIAAEFRVGRQNQGLPPLPDYLARTLRLSPTEAEALSHEFARVAAGEGPEGFAARLQAKFAEAADADEAQAVIQRWTEHVRVYRQRLEPLGELPALLRGAAGGYIPPSPGGDPVRMPDVLPSGRNIHALDPYRIPSSAAAAAAKRTVEKLLSRLKREQGDYPESIAMVLWGTDNIKTHGEGVAQALHLLGVEACPDSLGRMTRLRLIPLEELKRPRIDVVMTVSGIFRDIFPTVMDLLDRAVQMAASADEPPEHNFVRRKALRLAAEHSLDLAAAASRVFSNAPGMYGTGVNHAIEASDWDGRAELVDLFVSRKGYAYGGRIQGEPSQTLFKAALHGVSVTLQNLDSAEIGPNDVDHYFEYLGGLSAAVEHVNGTAVSSYLVDPLLDDGEARPLDEVLRLDVRTRLLNPKWYEAMLQHGYQGVSEIAARLDHVFGWSATTDRVDAWVYEAAADTFLLDERMLERLRQLNPQAVRRMTARILEADARGFWQADRQRRQRLEALDDELADHIEGLA